VSGPITHAVIPAGGLGTRLLPLTRALPKELLPLGRKPVIEHVVEEVGAAGIGHAVLVTGRGKTALIDHLDGLEALGVHVFAVRQPEPLGLGDAVARAEGMTGDGPFVVALGDCIVGGGTLRALMDVVRERDLDGAIAVERVPAERVGSYGIVSTGADGLITGIVEKPEPWETRSDLAVAARYVLPKAVFGPLGAIEPGHEGELQLTDAIAALIRDGARIAAVPLPEGVRRQDVGSPAGYCAAFVAHALADPELAPAVRRALADGER
jgi:UTP--glucose-1-phosphate uridylyltransferase